MTFGSFYYKGLMQHGKMSQLGCYIYVCRGVEIVKFSSCQGTSKWP